MSLSEVNNVELQSRLENLVRTERKTTRLVLEHIIEIEKRKLYAELGYDGLFSYLTKRLGYSESGAYRRIHSAKLLYKAPYIGPKLDDGSLNLSQLTYVERSLKKQDPFETPFSEEQTADLLSKIENKDLFSTKSIVAKILNQPILQPTILTPQQDDSVRVELTFTKEQYTDLITAKELLSHQIPDGDLAQVLSFLTRKFNQKKLRPEVRKASLEKPFAEGKTEEKFGLNLKEATAVLKKTSPAFQKTAHQRTPIGAALRRAVLEKASYECQFQEPSTGKRCRSRHQIEIDHIYPVAWGGTNNENNLQVLCRLHNQLRAQNMGLTPQPAEAKTST